MSNSKYPIELKIEIVKKYLSGEGSYQSLADAHGVSKRMLQQWTQKYREQGESGLLHTNGNAHYSKEFKINCVKAVINGEGSVDDIVANIIFRQERYSDAGF